MITIKEYYYPPLFDNNLMIKVTSRRQRKYFPVLHNHEKVRLTVKDFEKLTSKRVPMRFQEIRSSLDNQLGHYRSIAGQVKPFDLNTFTRRVKPDSGNLFSRWEEYARQCETEKRYSTAKSHRFSSQKFKQFSSSISFEGLNTDILRRFVLWTQDPKKQKKKWSPNSAAICLRNLRTIVNLERIDNPSTPYPFDKRKFVIKEGSSKRGDAFTLSQLKTFINSECPAKLQFAKDMFLFMFWAQGINYTDLARFRYCDLKGNRIEFIRKKTSDTTAKAKTILVPIDDFMRSIIVKYGTKQEFIFPILRKEIKREGRNVVYTYGIGGTEQENLAAINSGISQFNKQLKAYSQKINLPPISSYWVRHTWASIQLEIGSPTEIISQALGHKNITQTETYLRTLSEEKFRDAQSKMRDIL